MSIYQVLEKYILENLSLLHCHHLFDICFDIYCNIFELLLTNISFVPITVLYNRPVLHYYLPVTCKLAVLLRVSLPKMLHMIRSTYPGASRFGDPVANRHDVSLD